MKRRLLVALFVVVGVTPVTAQDDRVMVVVIPASQLPAWLNPTAPPPMAVTLEPIQRAKLTVPTTLYMAAIASELTMASVRCAIGCETWTRTLPGVSTGAIAIPLGLGINAATIFVTHKWIAPKWPRFAENLLMGLATFHSASTVDHASNARSTAKGEP